MKRSIFVVVGLLVLVLGAYGFGQSDTQEKGLDASTVEQLLMKGHKLLEKDADGLILFDPTERVSYRLAYSNLKTKAAEGKQSGDWNTAPSVPGRYQLIGENGWVYRIDTATGEVVGMPIGSQGWSRVGEATPAEEEQRPTHQVRGWTQQ